MIVVGQLDREPDVRYTRAGVPVARLLISSTRLYRGKSGDLEELPPEKFSVFAWRELAELVREARLKPGARLRVECVRQQNGTTKPVLVATDVEIEEAAAEILDEVAFCA